VGFELFLPQSHPTGQLKRVGLRQAKALFGSLDPPEWDGARSKYLAVGEY